METFVAGLSDEAVSVLSNRLTAERQAREAARLATLATHPVYVGCSLCTEPPGAYHAVDCPSPLHSGIVWAGSMRRIVPGLGGAVYLSSGTTGVADNGTFELS